jgi:hypothetical protein
MNYLQRLREQMITEEIIKETRHVGRGRPSKNSIQQEETKVSLQLHIKLIDTAMKEAESLAG